MKRIFNQCQSVTLMLMLIVIFTSLNAYSGTLKYQLESHKSKLQDYDFREMPVKQCIKSITESECLQVIYDPSLEDSIERASVNLKLKNATPMRALVAVLESQRLGYEYIDYKTLLIFQGVPTKSVNLVGVIWRDGTFSNFVEVIAQREGFEVIFENDNYKFCE